MKFINYLEKITGVGIFPLSSLALFFLFFTAVTVWALKADKGFINAMRHMPFPDQNQE